MTRIDEIKARLVAAKAEHPYEVADRHEIASQAWSDLYQHAPSDLEYLLHQLATRSHDLRIAEATADDRQREIQRLLDVLEEVGLQELAAKVTRVEALLDRVERDSAAGFVPVDFNGSPFPLTVFVREVRAALGGDDQ